MATALFLQGYKQQTYRAGIHVEILHGWSDDIIPPENFIPFAKSIGCSLHLLAGDHRLHSSIAVVEKLFSLFLVSRMHDLELHSRVD